MNTSPRITTPEAIPRMRKISTGSKTNGGTPCGATVGAFKQIKSSLPEGVRRFKDEHVRRHDAEILGMGRQEGQSVFLETESPACKPAVLTFTLEDEPAITTHTGHGFHPGKPLRWLYEEWNLDRRKRPLFEAAQQRLGGEVAVFRDFHYLVAEPFPPFVTVQAAQHVELPCRAGVTARSGLLPSPTRPVEHRRLLATSPRATVDDVAFFEYAARRRRPPRQRGITSPSTDPASPAAACTGAAPARRPTRRAPRRRRG